MFCTGGESQCRNSTARCASPRPFSCSAYINQLYSPQQPAEFSPPLHLEPPSRNCSHQIIKNLTSIFIHIFIQPIKRMTRNLICVDFCRFSTRNTSYKITSADWIVKARPNGCKSVQLKQRHDRNGLGYRECPIPFPSGLSVLVAILCGIPG